MAGEYQLSYTGPQVNEKLGKIDNLEVSINQIPSTYETKADALIKKTEIENKIKNSEYKLPVASSVTLGGIKVGNGLYISDEKLNVSVTDNLSDTSTVNPLSANQGKLLNDSLNTLQKNFEDFSKTVMLISVYDPDESGSVNNSESLEGYGAGDFLKSNNGLGTGHLVFNKDRFDGVSVGEYSFSLGNKALGTGNSSFASGKDSIASGEVSNASGLNTKAVGNYSKASNLNTEAQGEAQTVIGRYNLTDTTSVLIIGNGSSTTKSNAVTIDWEGNAWFAKNIYTGEGAGLNKKLSTEEYVDNAVLNVKNDLLNGAGEAYDTLKELGELIDDNTDAIDALEIIASSKASQDDLNNHVNNKSNPHEVTTEQIGAIPTNAIGAANGVPKMNANSEIEVLTGFTQNESAFYFTDKNDKVVTYINENGVNATNIYTVDKEYTKDSEGNVVETTYNLNYELAKLQKLYPLIISDTEPEDAFFWIDTSV